MVYEVCNISINPNTVLSSLLSCSKDQHSQSDCLLLNYLYIPNRFLLMLLHQSNLQPTCTLTVYLYFDSQYYQIRFTVFKWFKEWTSVNTDQTLNSEYIYIHNSHYIYRISSNRVRCFYFVPTISSCDSYSRVASIQGQFLLMLVSYWLL